MTLTGALSAWSLWKFEMELSYGTMVKETWWLDLDFLIELKYYLKGRASEALGAIHQDVKLILDWLEGALEAGQEIAGCFIAEIREILGLVKGCQPGGEVEMVDMGVEHYPTE